MKQFIEKCHSYSLKVTPQRMAIYKEIAGDRSHPSAENVYLRIKRDYPTISFDTVNRTLISFAKIGILNIVEGRGMPRKYDTEVGKHHHLHCIRCGEVTDFKDKKLDNLIIPKKIIVENKIISKRIVIEIICKKCFKK
jgi:Fur family peroxide stress response transcriptional regulator